MTPSILTYNFCSIFYYYIKIIQIVKEQIKQSLALCHFTSQNKSPRIERTTEIQVLQNGVLLSNLGLNVSKLTLALDAFGKAPFDLLIFSEVMQEYRERLR